LCINLFLSNVILLKLNFTKKLSFAVYVDGSRYKGCHILVQLVYDKSRIHRVQLFPIKQTFWNSSDRAGSGQLKFHPPFFLFLAWRPSWLEVGITGHNFERGPSKDHSTKVWLQLVQWFLRRRLKCEMLTDGRQTTRHVFKYKHTKWSHWCITASLNCINTMINRITMESVACLRSKCH
jgi:hypothetical protein